MTCGEKSDFSTNEHIWTVLQDRLQQILPYEYDLEILPQLINSLGVAKKGKLFFTKAMIGFGIS